MSGNGRNTNDGELIHRAANMRGLIQQVGSRVGLLLLAIALLFCGAPAARALFCPGPLPTLDQIGNLFNRANGALQQQFFTGRLNQLTNLTRGPDPSGTFQGAGGIGGLLARADANGAPALYHSDAAGNITAMINLAGVPQASYLYDPFGDLLALSGPLAAANHYRFSSKEVDPLSGDYYFGFRYYSPNLQRWRNADPIGLWGGLNVHRFVGNDPLGYVDPYGLSWWNPFTWFDPPGLKISPNGDMSMPPLPLPDRDSFGYLRGIDNDFNGKTGGQLVSDIGKSILENSLLAAAGALGPEEEGLADLAGAKKCEKAADDAAKLADPLRKHHSWPKYLGGAEKQGLMPLPKSLHDAFHSGLDKILPRQKGAAYYGSLSGAARDKALSDLADYVRAFDAKHETKIFDAMIKEGFPLP